MKAKSEIGKLMLASCREAAMIVLLCAALLAICGILVLKGILGQGAIPTAGIVCSAIAVFVGTLVCRRGQKGRLPWAGLIGCGIYLALVLLARLAMPGTGFYLVLPVLIGTLAAAVLACLFTGKKSRRSPVKRRKR